MGRILLAGILGGIALFVWGAISHMALPLGKMGMNSLPNDTVLIPLLKQVITERGFYFFPGGDENDETEEAMKVWEEKLRQGPRGVVIYDPSGGEMMSGVQLGTELGSNIAAALLAAIILAKLRGRRGTVIFMSMLMGLLAWLSIDVSYWNWYRFPDAFTCAQLIDQGVGWLLAGMAMALVLGKRQAQVGFVGAA